MKTLPEQVKIAVAEAQEAIESSRQRRAHLRRKTKKSDAHRQMLLRSEVEQLEQVMRPLRSTMGRIAYLDLNPKAEALVRTTSRAVQLERQKLHKMLKR